MKILDKYPVFFTKDVKWAEQFRQTPARAGMIIILPEDCVMVYPESERVSEVTVPQDPSVATKVQSGPVAPAPKRKRGSKSKVRGEEVKVTPVL